MPIRRFDLFVFVKTKIAFPEALHWCFMFRLRLHSSLKSILVQSQISEFSGIRCMVSGARYQVHGRIFYRKPARRLQVQNRENFSGSFLPWEKLELSSCPKPPGQKKIVHPVVHNHSPKSKILWKSMFLNRIWYFFMFTWICVGVPWAFFFAQAVLESGWDLLSPKVKNLIWRSPYFVPDWIYWTSTIREFPFRICMDWLV